MNIIPSWTIQLPGFQFKLVETFLADHGVRHSFADGVYSVIIDDEDVLNELQAELTKHLVYCRYDYSAGVDTSVCHICALCDDSLCERASYENDDLNIRGCRMGYFKWRDADGV